VVGQVLAGDPYTGGRLAGRGLGPVLVDAPVLKLKVSDPIRLPGQMLGAWRRRSSPIWSPGPLA
jgi:hypothetical protein